MRRKVRGWLIDEIHPAWLIVAAAMIAIFLVGRFVSRWL